MVFQFFKKYIKKSQKWNKNFLILSNCVDKKWPKKWLKSKKIGLWIKNVKPISVIIMNGNLTFYRRNLKFSFLIFLLKKVRFFLPMYTVKKWPKKWPKIPQNFFFWNVKLFILSKYDQKNDIKPKSVIFFKDHLFFTVEIKEKKCKF